MTNYLSRAYHKLRPAWALIALLVVLATPLGARAQNVAVTGNVKSLTGVGSGTGVNVRFKLRGYTGNVPRVNGTGVVLPLGVGCGVCVDLTPDINGNVASSIYGNDQITPAGTWYAVEYSYLGRIVFAADYLITGTAFNINNATALSATPALGPNQLITQLSTCSQPTTATVWTCTHNLGTTAPIVAVYDLTGNLLDPTAAANPYTVHATSINVITITFTNPQAGNATILTAGPVTIATTQPNAVLQNPTTSQTISAAQPFNINAPLSAPNPCTLSGLLYVNNGGCYATLAQAFIACPTGPSACNIDMRGASSALALGSFDPGNIAVTLYLGPFNYTVNQITIRPNLRIFGTGAFFGIQGQPPTILNATGGNATPPFVLAQVAGVSNVALADFDLIGTGGNTTQNGFNLIAPSNGGLAESRFENIQVIGFGGIGMNFDAQINGGIHQFLNFKQVYVYRNLNGNFALQIIGRASRITFDTCQFDGQFNTQDGKTNIAIGAGTNTIGFPYVINFKTLTSQYAGLAIKIDGADTINVDNGGFEATEGILSVGTSAAFGALNITMHDSGGFTSAGIGTVGGLGVGNGYIVNNRAATANATITVTNFHVSLPPDKFFIGNLGSITSFGNCYGPEGACVPIAPRQFGQPMVHIAGNAVDTGGLTDNVGVTIMYHVPATIDLVSITGAQYRICGSTTLTTPASGGAVTSTLPNVGVTYTDRNSSVVQTLVDVSPVAATAFGIPGQSTNAGGGNTTATTSNGCIQISAKANTDISYATTGYAASAANSMVYALHVRLEALDGL